MTVAEEIQLLVSRREGLTETQIAESLFDDAYQQRVNYNCRRLVKEGRLERRGSAVPIILSRTTYRYDRLELA
jgi:hypothetical protein